MSDARLVKADLRFCRRQCGGDSFKFDRFSLRQPAENRRPSVFHEGIKVKCPSEHQVFRGVDDIQSLQNRRTGTC